ncbi:hypothetical protein [Phascolarctobacterium succinatutens]|uniref:hypothetical protein n=1 Tax=Phascolarctobacterium succinatutens TaxID=626940 RepID=UPI004025CAA0
MSENLIPQIAQMLGVEIGEEFKIKDYELTCTITDDKGLMAADDSSETGWIPANALFLVLLNGKAEIVKIPWKPKMYEEYWTFGKLGKQWTVGALVWKELPYEILSLDKGWVYRSRAEACAALPAVAKEMGVEYTL